MIGNNAILSTKSKSTLWGPLVSSNERPATVRMRTGTRQSQEAMNLGDPVLGGGD